MKYPSYLVHFNPYHDPKNGQFTYSKSSGSTQLSPQEMQKADKEIYKAMRSKKTTASSFKNNAAIKQLSEDPKLLKAKEVFIEKYEKWKKTGWPGGLNSASEAYSDIKYNLIQNFAKEKMRFVMSTNHLNTFTDDWRDEIYRDDYGSRLSSLIDYELGMDDVVRYWQPDKSVGAYDWDDV